MNPLASTLEREADRLRHDRVEPAVERAREAIEDAPDAAGRAAERARRRLGAEGREAADRLTAEGRDLVARLETFLDDHEEQVTSWGERVVWAAVGFLAGFLVGWLVARRGDDDREDELDVEPAPAGTDVASRAAAKRAGEPVEL